jgi:pSer/pThr/pTyr-binding forkhead associated (FHA) protein
MLQLEILSGKQAGFLWDSRRFPVRVGRGASCDLQIEAEGVWEQHFEITLNATTGFHLSVHPDAVVMVNQVPVTEARLNNGDVLTAGAAKLSFRLSPPRQRSLKLREWSVWLLLAGVTAGQILIVDWLLR